MHEIFCEYDRPTAFSSVCFCFLQSADIPSIYRLPTKCTILACLWLFFEHSLWQATLNAQEQNRAVTRYFTQSELKQLFQLVQPHRSETCEQVLLRA